MRIREKRCRMKKRIIPVILTAAVTLCGCFGGNVTKRQVKQEAVVACGKNISDVIGDIMNDFTVQSSTTQVKLIELSDASRDLCQAYASILSGREVQLDAMFLEDVWVDEFVNKGFLYPLDGSVTFDGKDFQPGISDFARVDGKLYWYPLILDTGIMYYRKDITDGRLDYRRLSEQRDIKYAVQGSDGEEMICCAMEFISLADSVRNGLELYKKAIEGAVVSDNPVTGFLNGDAAYVRAWASENNSITKGYSPVTTQIGARVLKKNDKESYATARAYGIAVNAASGKTDNIKELLDYLSKDDVQIKIVKETNTMPLRWKDYKNPSVTYRLSYIDEMFPAFGNLNFRPKKSNYSYLSRQAGNALSDYINGAGTLENAAETMEKLLGKMSE